MPYPPKDGGAIATFSLAQNLSEIADSVDIIAINTSKHYFDINKIPNKITKKIKFYDYYLNTDIKIVDLLKNLFFSKTPYNAQRFINENFAQEIEKLLIKKKYDIVQMEGLYVLPYIDVVRNNSNAKIAYRAHNIEHKIWQRTCKNTKNFFKKIYIKNLTKRIKKFEEKYINSYDLLIPITNIDKKNFEKLGNKKPALTISTGINIEKYQNNKISPEKNSIFHIGALDWAPNQEGLLWFIDNCWKKIHKQKPYIKFYIAGRNAPKWFIKHIKYKNIEFLGEVDDAYKFINSKAIMIVPLLSGSGMRIKIIEGMALAKAIITTSIGIEGIAAKNNKNIIIADNTEEFTQKVIELNNHQNKIKEIGNNAKILVSENFDNFAIAKKLYNFYKHNLNNF